MNSFVRMKNILPGIAIFLILSVVLTACESDNETLLSEGLWNFQDMSTDSEESAIISIVSLGEALLTGATMEFQEGGTYILTSALVETPVTGKWQLIGNDQLVLEPDGESSSTSTLDVLTRDKLIYTESFMDGQVNSYKVTTTWTR